MIVEDDVRIARAILHDHESGSASPWLRGVRGSLASLSQLAYHKGDGQAAKQRVNTRRTLFAGQPP